MFCLLQSGLIGDLFGIWTEIGLTTQECIRYDARTCIYYNFLSQVRSRVIALTVETAARIVVGIAIAAKPRASTSYVCLAFNCHTQSHGRRTRHVPKSCQTTGTRDSVSSQCLEKRGAIAKRRSRVPQISITAGENGFWLYPDAVRSFERACKRA